MAYAPNITHLFIIFQAIVMLYIFPPSLRQMLHLQRRFHPKSQYRCHWFKQRMKRKKRKRFRMPKPLFHLTWKYKAVTLTLCALVTWAWSVSTQDADGSGGFLCMKDVPSSCEMVAWLAETITLDVTRSCHQ
jgi:hypothetical protein